MSELLATIWIPTGNDLSLFRPELALIATIVALLVVPLFAGNHKHLTATIALTGTLITLLMTALVAEDVWEYGQAGFFPPEAAPMLIADRFSVFFKFFLMLFLSLIIGLWLIGVAVKDEKAEGLRPETPSAVEFFVLLLTSALGMALMVNTLNLLVMLIAIEMASLPSYAIVGSNKRSRRGAEASLKYVTFGAASSSIMVYGVSLMYGCFGTLDIPTIAQGFAADPSGVNLLAWMGLMAMCTGIAFKISAVPFHFWCPDVFEGAPIEVTTWLSVASKAAGLGLIVRLVTALSTAAGGSMMPFAIGIGIVAAVTCTVGNLAALRQKNVKRMLAYSSIAHAGYMLMAAAVLVQPEVGVSLNSALAALIAYLFVYLLMNLGAFGVTAMVIWHTGSDHISSFTGLGRRCPWLAFPMALCLFSLVGLPPLGGFAAKWWLLAALGRAAMSGSGQTWLWALIVVAGLNTAISLFYYISVIRQMYLTDDVAKPKLSAPMSGVAMVNVCAVALLLLGTLFFNQLGKQSREFASKLIVTSTSEPLTHEVEPKPADADLVTSAMNLTPSDISTSTSH